MSISAYFPRAAMQRRLHEGPLGAYIDLYAAQLLKEGHCRQSAWRCLRVVADFSRWLARKRMGLNEVNERTVEKYQDFRSRYRRPFSSDHPALNRLLAVLRGVNAIATVPPAQLDPREQILNGFERFLLQECGLAWSTIVRNRPVIRCLLSDTRVHAGHDLSRLTAADIKAFVVRHAHDHSPRSAQIMCSAVRVFMRYLHYTGQTATDLSSSVPNVRRWSLTSLPSYLSSAQVQQVLDACDLEGATGLRDYAILLLLARLGLRANEIAMLALDDVDWPTGQVTVQGKGRKRSVLPLLPEVGAAIAAYLQYGRPRSDSRRLFLRALAPHSGFASSGTVSMVAAIALKRIGVHGVAHKGAHLFRHSLATELLRSGASLNEIGQVLRHQHHDTTRIYAKVDIEALRKLGLPWPGGAR